MAQPTMAGMSSDDLAEEKERLDNDPDDW